MKNRILVIIICFFTLTNCGLDDDIEYGERTLSSENDDTLLTINTNNLSNSTVADGFTYTFERELIVVVE